MGSLLKCEECGEINGEHRNWCSYKLAETKEQRREYEDFISRYQKDLLEFELKEELKETIEIREIAEEILKERELGEELNINYALIPKRPIK